MSIREILTRLLSSVHHDEYRDRLTEAQSKLNEETRDLTRELDKMGERHDPIGSIISNIKQVRGR